MKPIALYYLAILPVLRNAAAGMGYALGLHGSLQRDLDLIAAPWSDAAKPPDELAEALRTAVNGSCHLPSAAERPHGRRCYVIHLPHEASKDYGAYIDLSVMPRREAPAHGA